MVLAAPSPTIAAIWSAFATQDGPPSSITRSCRSQVPSILSGAAAKGGTGILEVETVLLAAGIGVPAGTMADTLTLFGIAPEWVYRRPRSGSTAAFGIERIAAFDFARLLILVERAGFRIDPACLCERLLPALKAKPYLTSSELAVYWHARERHRIDPLKIASDPGLVYSRVSETRKASTGYRADLILAPDGEPGAMVVMAPRWRRRPNALSRAA